MNLLAPLMLAGLVGLGLPVLAHLLGQQPPVVVRFAGRRFLEPREPTVTQRRRIHDIPLLIIRLLMLAALVLALSRPVTPDTSGLAVVGEPHDAIVLIDASRSMELVVDGQSLRDRALDRAEDIVSSLPEGSRVGLVTSDPSGPELEPDLARERALAAIDELREQETWRRGAWNLGQAATEAATLLPPPGGEGDRERVIYAVGDLTGAGLGSLPPSAGEAVGVIPVPALGELDAPVLPPEHVGISQVGWVPAPELDPRALRIRAEVRRHGPYDDEGVREDAGPRTVGVALEIGGEEVSRGEVDLPPGDAAVVELTHTVLDAADATPATLRLVEDGDPMPGDDRRHLWLSARDRVRVGVVNGDPSELRTSDETYFLSTALVSAATARGTQLRGLAPDQLESMVDEGGPAALGDFDVLVLANVRAPREDVAAAIRTRVEAGMGLWIAVGDRVEPKAYNAVFDALLPLRMRGAQLAGSLPGRTNQRTESMAPANLAHPVFSDLEVSSGTEVGLASTKTRRLMLLEPDPKRGARAALSFASGGPALVTREVGRGRVALLTTTIDRDWTDLPLRPGFVPTVQHMVSWLAGRSGTAASTELTVGTPWTTATDGPLSVETPAGVTSTILPDPEGQAIFEDTWRPGHYTVRRPSDDEDDDGLHRVFATVVDAAESDTTPVQLDDSTGLDEDGATAQVRINRPRWRSLLLLGLALFALEAVARVWLRRRGRS